MSKRLVCLVIVLTLVGAKQVALADDPPISRNFQRAQTFVEQGKYEQALPFLNASIKELKSPENLYLRGHVLLKLGRPSVAKKDANTLVDKFEHNWRGYFLKVRCILDTGALENHKEPLFRLLRKTLQYKPDHKRARLLLGRVYAAKGQTKQALDAFQQVPDRIKQDPVAGRIAARIAFLEGNDSLASSLAQELLVMAPDDPVAARIHSFVEKGVEREVERRIQQFERRSGEMSREDRLSKLKSLRERFPDIAHLLIFCSRNVLELGKKERAMQLAKRAENVGADAWTAFLMGRVFEKKKRYADAAQWYLKVCERRDPFGPARLRAGICLSRDGQHKRAIRELRKVFDRVSINEEASVRLVQSCLNTGHLVYVRDRLDRLTLSSEKRKTFRKRLDEALAKRRKQEEDAVEDQVYRNSFYGIELSLPDHWGYSLDAGRSTVVALFVNTTSPDRFFIVAEKRLPAFRDRSVQGDQVISQLREYLISKFLLKDTTLQFLKQRIRNDLNRQMVEYVFRGLEGNQRMHCFVMFRDKWMLTFHYVARGKRKESRQRMKEIIKRVIIREN